MKTIIYESGSVLCRGYNLKSVGRNQYRHPVVTFSAWSSQPPGPEFGIRFFTGKAIPTVTVVAKQNHWWQCDDLDAMTSRINAALRGRNPILYGSSMGGYGALHLRSLLNASCSFCITPQISVDPEIASFDQRWIKDWRRIQPRFEELANAQRQAAPAFIFSDPLHDLDAKHFELLGSTSTNGNSLSPNFLVPIPYTLHDAARVLVRSGFLQPYLLDAVLGRLPAIQGLREEASQVFRRDAKAFFNYVRRFAPSDLSSDDEDQFRSFVEQAELRDFESAYMIAECFSKRGEHKMAIFWSERSLEVGPSAASYLYLKHFQVLRAANQKETLESFWEQVPLDVRPAVQDAYEKTRTMMA